MLEEPTLTGAMTMRELYRAKRAYRQTCRRLFATPPYLPPLGWYPNPVGAAEWRWWDGERWTSTVAI